MLDDWPGPATHEGTKAARCPNAMVRGSGRFFCSWKRAETNSSAGSINRGTGQWNDVDHGMHASADAPGWAKLTVGLHEVQELRDQVRVGVPERGIPVLEVGRLTKDGCRPEKESTTGVGGGFTMRKQTTASRPVPLPSPDPVAKSKKKMTIE